MASDIRILSEYVPQLRGAISAAFGTADTEALQKRGIGAVEFLTKVNAELGKLPQVGNTAKNALENFQDALFLAGASLGEVFLPAVIKILALITPLVGGLAEMRGALALVTVAVLAATVAMVAFHTGAVGGVVAGAARLVSSLQAVYVSMRLVAAGATTMAASTVVGLAGWVGLVAILGAVAYGLYTVLTAEKEIVAATDEQVKATARQVSLRESELELLKSLGDGTRAAADEQLKQKELYDALDASGRARVDAMAEETSRTQALAEETRRLLETERERQRVQGANLAAKFALELEKLNRLTAEQAGAEQFLLGIERERLRVAREASQGYRAPETFAEQPDLQAAIDAASNRSQELNAELETQDKLVRGLALSLINYGNTTEHSIESAFELARTLGLSQKAAASLVAEVERLSKEQKSAAGHVDETTAALERQQKAASQLASIYDEESKRRREVIEHTITNIANSSAGDVGLAREQLRQYLNDPVFREAVETERKIKRIRKALDEIIDPVKVRHQKDAAEKLTDRLKALRAEVESFSDLKSPSFDTRFEAEALERVKRDYERILDLRRELRLPLRAALPGPQDDAGIRAQLESLEALKRVRDDILKVTQEQRDAEEAYAAAVATSTIPVVDAGLRAETKYVKALRDRRSAERELTADLITQTRLRRDAVEDEVGATKKAYESIKIELLKQLDDLDEAVTRNQMLALLERGGELEVQTRISGRVDVKPPAPPSELKLIAENSVKQTTSLHNIELALTGGATGAGKSSAEFAARTALTTVEAWLKAHGAGGAITARGQSATHNRLDLDHRNAFDVGLDPGSAIGRQFIAYLQSQGFPFRAITAADIARGVKGTGPHVHVGEPSRASTRDYAPGTMLGAPREPESGVGLVDKAVAFVVGWAKRLANPEALKVLAGGEEAVRTDTTVVKGPTYEELTRERALKTAIKERGDRERELNDEIRQNEYRLAFDLIDIDLEVAAARSRTRVERRAEERAVEVELRALRAEAADDQLSEQRRLLAAKQEELDLTKRTVALQDEYANSGVNAGLRRQVAVMEEVVAIRRADVEAIEQQARAEVRLADQTVLHSEQVRARVLEHLASQKSATDAYADTITGAYDAITGAVSSGISKLTGGVKIVDNLLASIFNRIISRVFQRFLDAFFPAGGGGGGGVSTPGFAGGSLPGLSSSGGSGFSLTGLLGRLFDGGVQGAPPVPTSSSVTRTGPWVDPTAFTARFGEAPRMGAQSGLASLFQGLGPSLAAALPLLAVSYGITSWQGALRGQLTDFQAATGSGILGFFTNRSKRRQEEEKKRNTYANELGTAVWQMIADIKGGVDASSALTQLPALEQQYLQQANAIKDSKTRRHALLWFNNPPETGDYQAAKKILMQVANESLEAKARAQNQVPEYANGLDGGLVGQHLIKVKPGERFLPPEAVAALVRSGGLIPGAPSALDNTYMYAPTGSAVLNEDQQRAMQGAGARMLPVPASATPWPPTAAPPGGVSAAPVIDLSGLGFNVTIIEGERRDEKDVILEVMSSLEGGRVIARHTAKAKVHNRG